MAIWNKQNFEELLERKLNKVLTKNEAEAYYQKYTSARNKLIEEIYGEIAAAEPDLTRHDSSHIKNVLKRVYHLIDEDSLNAHEIYALGMIVLFHDVGNIKGRDGHQSKKRVAEIYNKVRGEDHTKYIQERNLILSAVEAHTGRDTNGNVLDTLKKVDEFSNLEDGEKIRLRELAAILRFGDECEEGPHRTSLYRQELSGEKGGYSEESLKYHEYSNIANIFIDRGSGRVVITCHLNYNPIDDPDGSKFKSSLEVAYGRIIKLDEERKYTRYYSNILIPFKKTEVSFQFNINNLPIENLLIQKIELEDDIPVPGRNGSPSKSIVSKYPECDITKVFEKIKAEVES